MVGVITHQANQALNRISVKHGIIFAVEKEETITFRAGKRALRSRSCKVLGVQIKHCLLFHHHMEYRAGIARKAWGAFGRLGNMRKGLSPTSWRQLYTGMIRPMMLWGMELAWRAEGLLLPSDPKPRTGWTSMQRIEAAAARKTTGAYTCASTEKVLAIAGIEPLHVKMASM